MNILISKYIQKLCLPVSLDNFKLSDLKASLTVKKLQNAKAIAGCRLHRS